MPLDQLFRVLSVSLGPVILISGVGLLLLSMTNRFGRVIDRARILSREMRQNSDPVRGQMLNEQLNVIYRRGKILRGAIFCSAASVLCVSLGVLCLFGSQILAFARDFVSPAFFLIALVLIVPGVSLFIQDMLVSLHAVELEIRTDLAPSAESMDEPRAAE